jgi:glycosyltransferase involved in cell wall biosynthesis
LLQDIRQTDLAEDEYLTYHFRGKFALAFPVVDRRMRLAALRRFPFYSFKRRVFRRALQIAIFLNLDSLFSQRSIIPHPLAKTLDFSAWLDRVKQQLQRSDLFPVIHAPVQAKRHRLYVHLLDTRGEPVAFAKLALDELNNAQLLHELNMVSLFNANPPEHFRVPVLLCQGLFQGHRYLVVEPLPDGAHAASMNWEVLRGYLQELYGMEARVLDVNEMCATAWWQGFNEIASQLSPQFIEELRSLIGEFLPVGSVHGDPGVNNLVRVAGKLWIIDWEGSSNVGPRRTDEISHYLSSNQQRILHYPRLAITPFANVFLARASKEDRRDVMAALAYLAATRRDAAWQIIRHWDEISKARYAPLDPSLPPTLSSKAAVNLAIISDQPTAKRAPLLERIGRELTECTVHNIFTHSISNPAMPWEMGIPPHLNPVFFSADHLSAGGHISRRSLPLFRKIRDYLVENDVRLIILSGCCDLAHLLLIRWARKRGVYVLLTGENNVFSAARGPWLSNQAKRYYYNWVLGAVAGLMPMGTCGEAYYRSLRDHDLPEFLFPYEPDYAALRKVDRARDEELLQTRRLDPGRKRFLFCGRLTPSARVDVLIDAFISIAFGLPDWDLVIAGDGELRRGLQASVPTALASRIRFIGYVNRDRMPSCYRACDVLVDPSDDEPWGMEINEAVACGLAVIATSVIGSAVELVRHRDNGLLVAPRSVPALAEAMRDVSQRDTLRRMRAASAGALRTWLNVGDPLNGVRRALNHFNLLPYQETAQRNAPAVLKVGGESHENSPVSSMPTSQALSSSFQIRNV